MSNRHNRKNYFVDKGFQTRYILEFCLLVVLAGVLMGALTLFFTERSTTVAFENTRVVVKRTADFIFPIMAQTIILVAISSAIAVGILTMVMTHKMAGPLYRMKNEIDRMRQGYLSPNFKIRKDDQLHALAASLTALAAVWRDKQALLKSKVARLKGELNHPLDMESLSGQVKELEEIIDSFKM